MPGLGSPVDMGVVKQNSPIYKLLQPLLEPESANSVGQPVIISASKCKLLKAFVFLASIEGVHL